MRQWPLVILKPRQIPHVDIRRTPSISESARPRSIADRRLVGWCGAGAVRLCWRFSSEVPIKTIKPPVCRCVNIPLPSGSIEQRLRIRPALWRGHL
jgi:hypothetical protein